MSLPAADPAIVPAAVPGAAPAAPAAGIGAPPRRGSAVLAMGRRGPVLMLGASLCFALMGACVKYVSSPPAGGFAPIPVAEVVFWRSAIATLVAAVVAWPERRRLVGVARGMLVTRSLVGLASMYAYFFAISRLKLGDAVLLTHLSPLIVAAMSPFVLGERATRAVWVALAIGFTGVWVVEDPSGELAGAGLIAGLASAVFAASAYVSVKVLSRTDTPATIVLWFSAIGALVSGGHVLLAGSWVTPAPSALAALAGVGILAALAQLLMTRAYSVSAAARVAVFAYATPVIAYVLGQTLLAEPIGWRGALGCALLVTAGAVATFLSSDRPPAAGAARAPAS